MVYKRLPNNLPEILRSYGLKVVEVDGWKTRGRDASHGGFDPVGTLCHHTATGKNWTDARVVKMLIEGRPDLPGPLVQFGLARDATVYLVASGRCNHAGTAKASGTVAAGDGNELYVGIEGFNSGLGEPWPKVQYDAYVLLSAVLSIEITKNSAKTVRGHKETSFTGKPDPKFDMFEFRADVADKMKALLSTSGGSSVTTNPPVTGNAASYIMLKATDDQVLPLNKWVLCDLGPADLVLPAVGADDFDFYINLDFDTLKGAKRNDLRYILGRWARHDPSSKDLTTMGGFKVDVTGADTKAISQDLPKRWWRSTWSHGFKGQKGVPTSFWVYIGSMQDGSVEASMRIFKVDDET